MHKVGKLPIWGKNWDRDLSEVVERKVLKKAKQKLPEALKKKIAIIIVIVDHLWNFSINQYGAIARIL